MSINRWMDKEDVVWIHNRILLRHKKTINPATYNNMDGPGDYHTKWSKSERERQITYDIIYMWDLKIKYKWTYLWNRNRLTDIGNKLMVTKGEGGKDKLGVGISRYTLLYIK